MDTAQDKGQQALATTSVAVGLEEHFPWILHSSLLGVRHDPPILEVTTHTQEGKGLSKVVGSKWQSGGVNPQI